MEEKAMCLGVEGIRGPHAAGDRGESSAEGEERAGRKGMWWGREGQRLPRGERKDWCMQEGTSGCTGEGYGGS